MAAAAHSVTSVREEVTETPAPTGAQTGAKLFFATVGLGAGWYLYQTGVVQDATPTQTYSFKPPYRLKTTYLLYATTIAGYLVGGVIGNALYGQSKKPKAPITPSTKVSGKQSH